MQRMYIANLPRLVLNLIRFGTIAEIDHAKAQCRVQTGELITDWLAWLTPFAGSTRSWHAPTMSEPVLLLCPEGELAAGVVLCGLYSKTHPAPSTDPALHTICYPDGACLSYHSGTGTLSATGLQHAAIEASTITLKGQVTIEGSLTQSGGDVSSNGIILHTHQHGGVRSGGSKTGGPQ